jgi:predicted nucleic acid-binding protein
VGLAVLDSSTVVGYLDADDLLHDEAVAKVEAALRAGMTPAISAITWAELLHGAALGHREEAAVRGFVTDFGVAIVAVDAAVAERAAALQVAYARRSRGGRLKTPDALILASADLDANVERVICGDDQWPKVPGVRPRITLIRERRR